MKNKTITVLAGQTVHPTTEQFHWLSERAPDGYTFQIHEGAQTFRHLADTDLFIAAGLYWTGSANVKRNPAPYTPPSDKEKEALRDYIESGRPVLAFHGGIASFNDWPDYGRMLGFAWHWDITKHGPIKAYRVYPKETNHPAIEGVEAFETIDENYFNVQLNLGVSYQTHLMMDCGNVQLPMLLTSDGNHYPSAGPSAYLALGHDMQAIDNPGFQTVFWNAIKWLLHTQGVKDAPASRE